jgi:membrane-associated phospholipid phosphatase
VHSLIIFAAKYLVLVPIIANLYIFWELNNKDRKKMLVFGLSGAVLCIVLAKLGSHLYSDPRPPFKDHAQPFFQTSDYNGFPSDHTLLAGWLAFLALAFSKKIGLALLVVAAIVGWGRVAAHVHHLTDIIGSLAITSAVYLVMSQVLKMSESKKLNHDAGRKPNGT